jgi:hypothetical protein
MFKVPSSNTAFNWKGLDYGDFIAELGSEKRIRRVHKAQQLPMGMLKTLTKMNTRSLHFTLISEETHDSIPYPRNSGWW